MRQEKEVDESSGWPMLALTIVLYAAVFGLIPVVVAMKKDPMLGWVIGAQIGGWLAAVLLSIGFLIVESNGSKVLQLFGSYKGTVKCSGFHWADPLLLKRNVSLRARTLNGDKLNVDGAVGMVEMALERLERHKTINLDDERKAAMVPNLMVVLCSEQAAQPAVNTGTLYR